MLYSQCTYYSSFTSNSEPFLHLSLRLSSSAERQRMIEMHHDSVLPAKTDFESGKHHGSDRVVCKAPNADVSATKPTNWQNHGSAFPRQVHPRHGTLSSQERGDEILTRLRNPSAVSCQLLWRANPRLGFLAHGHKQ